MQERKEKYNLKKNTIQSNKDFCKKLIDLFSKDSLNWLKVAVKISISNE